MEPWLTGATYETCEAAPDEPGRGPRCARTTLSDAPCDELIDSHRRAIRLLRERPRCNDAVIDALERFGRVHADALSDLSAAYYIRAQQEGRPEDLAEAYGAANRALKKKPGSRAALFNRALALEAMLLPEAIAAWDQVSRDDAGGWGVEARQHAERLAAQRRRNEATTWETNRGRLAAALQQRNRAEVARLIQPYATSAMNYWLDEVLPLWVHEPTQEHFERAMLFATVLSQRMKGDPFATDVMQAIARAAADPDVLEAHRLFVGAQKAPAALYQSAAARLQAIGSPLRFLLLIAAARSGVEPAVAALPSLEEEARQRGYLHIAARIRSTRGYRHFFPNSRYFDALADYDLALADYERLGDEEGRAIIHTRRIGVLYTIGQRAEAWREVLVTRALAHHLGQLGHRHLFLGESGTVAQFLGHPEIALLIQNEALRAAQALPTEPEQLRRTLLNLAIALRGRADLFLTLDRTAEAQADIDEARRLLSDARMAAENDENRAAVLARIEEVEGRMLLLRDPARAAGSFRRALDLATTKEHQSWFASVRANRAEALRIANDPGSVEEFEAALAIVREGEKQVLQARAPGEREWAWSEFFGRFRPTYDILVDHLMNAGQPRDAFDVAERVRAIEPLDLVQRLRTTPPEFLRLISADGAIPVGVIQKALPLDTDLLAYSVLDDRTHVWIVSRDAVEPLVLNVRREETSRWTAAIRDAARKRNDRILRRRLNAPYDALLAKPLEVIRRRRGAGAPLRLVIVPDGGMHGLPFAALRNGQTGRHLIEEATVSIAGSATLYLYALMRDAAWPAGLELDALVVGDPDFRRELPLAAGLKPLPGAEQEARDVAALYDGAETLLGAEATAAQFLARAEHARMIHFAGHSIANPGAPSRSILLLAPSPEHSGAVEAQELVGQLELERTQLVALSACSTAGGLPLGPEGIAPLVRSFVGAGVPAVIGTLWDVNDATPAMVAVSFHRHYRNGLDAAAAMQAAQLDQIRGGEPVLSWAPFQVIGHASSPFAAAADLKRREKPP